MGPVIIGAGGHAADIAVWFPLSTIAHHEQALQRLARPMIVGINDPKTRADVCQQLEKAGWTDADAHIHPQAYRGGYVALAGGVVVAPFAYLGTEVKLDRHVHVGSLAHLTRCQVGEFTTIGPGAVVCGDVTIGKRCLIGAGAVVKNLVTIGDGVTVGAGAAVVCDVPNGMTVTGVPARPR